MFVHQRWYAGIDNSIPSRNPESVFMKKPLRLLLNRKTLALFLLLAAGTIYLCRNFETFHEFEGSESEEEREREEHESPAEVFGAMDQWGRERSYPSGDISAQAYVDAYEHMKRMPEIKFKSTAQQRIQASNWTPLGPMNFAGRVLSLAFHPTNPNVMFAGSASGGLWKTTNGGIGTAGGGLNWTQVQTGFPTQSVPAIAINPIAPSEMYIGTGEVYAAGTSGFPGQDVRTFRGSYGIGILKSNDFGVTWNYSLNFSNSTVKGVYDIRFNPRNPDTVFAATSDGLYRSTNDGASWTLIHSVPLTMDMEFSPTDPNTLYITSGDLGSAGTGIYKSTNALATTPTFTQLTTGLPTVINGMIRISICPDNANRIFASVGKLPGTTSCSGSCNYGLYLSTNGGTSWTRTANQPLLGGSHYMQNQGWYAHDVLAAPTTNNSVYVSEIDMTKSTDGGANWPLSGTLTQWSLWDFSAAGGTLVGDSTEGQSNNMDYVHADHHHIYFSPHDPTYNTIWVVTDGGVFRSTDGGANFKSCNGGLMTAQIYHKMSCHPTNSNLMLCGLQDNATLYYQGSTGCRRVTGGDGFYTAIDQTNPNNCYATYTYGTWYRSTSGLTGFGGAAWTNTMNTGTSTPNEYAAFVAPVVLTNDGSKLYVGTVKLKRFASPSTSATPSDGNGGGNISGPTNSIMAIGVSKTFGDSIYIATAPGGGNPGRVYRSTNGGNTVTNITGTLPDRYFSYIAVDPNNSQRVAVAVSGFGTSHVYFSSNGGTTWNNIGGVGGTALPNVPANVAMFDPTTPTTLYVATDLGVFVAQNITTGATQPTWYSYNAGWTDVTAVMDLLVAPNGKLRAGAFGKGLWENAMVTGNLPVKFESFTVSTNQNGNQLKWVIATQENVDHYEVEYSTDGINFGSIASVAARAGTSNLTYNYLHKISNVSKGFYRIKVVDQDGEVMYSAVEEVKAQGGVVKLITYPNPTTGKFRIRIPSDLRGNIELSMYDDIGRLVHSDRMAANGNTEFPVDISRFATGNYQVVCEINSTKYVTRILKK